MPLAAIMVHVDFDKQAEDRIAVAAGLAQRFNALLIGVAGWPLRKRGAMEHSAVEFPPVEEARQEKITEQLDRLGEKFRRSAGANPRGVEWRSSAHFPSEIIAREARAADLVVIGRKALPGDVYHTFDPGAVILASGRPVLVVPRGIRRLQDSRVLIAWKDTREARRALGDALPFLERGPKRHHCGAVRRAWRSARASKLPMSLRIGSSPSRSQRTNCDGCHGGGGPRPASPRQGAQCRFDRGRRLWAQPTERMDLRRSDPPSSHDEQSALFVFELTQPCRHQ